MVFGCFLTRGTFILNSFRPFRTTFGQMYFFFSSLFRISALSYLKNFFVKNIKICNFLLSAVMGTENRRIVLRQTHQPIQKGLDGLCMVGKAILVGEGVTIAIYMGSRPFVVAMFERPAHYTLHVFRMIAIINASRAHQMRNHAIHLMFSSVFL